MGAVLSVRLTSGSIEGRFDVVDGFVSGPTLSSSTVTAARGFEDGVMAVLVRLRIACKPKQFSSLPRLRRFIRSVRVIEDRWADFLSFRRSSNS